MPLEHTPEDEALVSAQLGRPVRGRWEVARRCHLGLPMVIENYPRLEDGSPFPTLYWLTCPVLLKRVSTLESEGHMSELNARLAEDDVLRFRMQMAVERLTARRDSHEVIPNTSAPPGGGPDKIKCLHAHTAQELALPPDAAGSLALSETGWPDCVAPCVEGAAT